MTEKKWNVYYWNGAIALPVHSCKARNAPDAILKAYKAKGKKYKVWFFARPDRSDPYKSDPTTRELFRRVGK